MQRSAPAQHKLKHRVQELEMQNDNLIDKVC